MNEETNPLISKNLKNEKIKKNKPIKSDINLFVFGLLKFITGLAPSIILRRLKVHGKRKVWLDKAMGGVLCIGGGVLLATVFVHMLPEVRESIDTAKKQLQKATNETKNGTHHGHDHSNHHDHEDHNEDHEGVDGQTG